MKIKKEAGPYSDNYDESHMDPLRLQQHIYDEHDKLLDAVPEWKDSRKCMQDMREIETLACDKFGMREEEIHMMNDHRLFLILREIWLIEKEKELREEHPTLKRLYKQYETARKLIGEEK